MKFSQKVIILTFFVLFLLKLAFCDDEGLITPTAQNVKVTTDNDVTAVQNVTVTQSLTEKILNGKLLQNLDLSRIFDEASNEIGFPFALRETLIETLREKGFLQFQGAANLFNKDER